MFHSNINSQLKMISSKLVQFKASSYFSVIDCQYLRGFFFLIHGYCSPKINCVKLNFTFILARMSSIKNADHIIFLTQLSKLDSFSSSLAFLKHNGILKLHYLEAY